MIKQSDLKNRFCVNGECVDFDYYIEVDEKRIRCRFLRDDNNSLIWSMHVVLYRTKDCDSQVYCFSYQLPKSNMNLTMIAAIGLKYFQLYLKEEIQTKINLDFCLGEITDGMVG